MSAHDSLLFLNVVTKVFGVGRVACEMNPSSSSKRKRSNSPVVSNVITGLLLLPSYRPRFYYQVFFLFFLFFLFDDDFWIEFYFLFK